MLATDPELDPRPRGAAALDSHADQLPHAFLVEGLERVRLEQLELEVLRHEATLDVVTREPEGHLGEVVRPEGEELGDIGDLTRRERGAWGLDHRAHEVVDIGVVGTGERGGRHLAHPIGQERELGLGNDERDHDLDVRIAAGLLAGDGRLDDRLGLHLVEAGLEDAEPTPARAEHRVGLPPHLRDGQHAATLVVELALGVADEQLLDVGEELVERRVEEADGHGQAVHRLEDPLEVGALQLLELVERVLLLDGVGGEDEALHERETVP